MELKPGYKQTEVGVLPEDWEVKRLGQIGKVVRGGSPRPAGDPKFFDGDFIPWLTVAALTNIPDHQLEVRHTETRLTEEGSKQSRTLQRGTVIIANSGATLGVAKVSAIECCANDGIAAIIDQHVGEKAFVCHCINAQTQRLREVVATGNGQPNLNTGLIKDIAIPWPPQAEQAAIAECISDLDELLRCLEEAIIKKQSLKQGAMQELLTGKRRLPGFEGEWEVKSVGDFADCTSGGTPATGITAYWGGNIRWMSSGELHLKRVAEVTGRITTSGLENSSAKLLPPKCVLVGLAGQGKTRGTTAISLVELSTNQSIAAILPNPSFVPEYLYYCFDSRYEELRELSSGSGGRGGLNLSLIKSLRLPMPTPDEQAAISAALSDMDCELNYLEDKLSRLRDIKQGMMQQLLTGKIRLT